ncbi:MAG: hypothetical protein CMP76_03375 [Flavobacterium sp.]|nr:hypothetical protein [Flavobacterium sp.]
MEIMMNKRLILLLVLMSFQNVFSDSTPPPPPPTPPPGLPIDNGVVAMIFAGLIFGYYIIRKADLKKKFK